MSDQIIRIAEQLGKAIADSPQSQALDQARQQAQGDPEAMKLMNEFQSQAEKIARQEQMRQPIEPADKQKLEGLQGKVAGNGTIKKFTEAQMQYVDLMQRVSQTIHQQLAGPEEEPQQQ